MFKKNFIGYFFIFIIILILMYSATSSSALFTDKNENIEYSNSTFHYNSDSEFSWPIYGYYTISSFFGKRTSPTTGASTNHSGIDIPAPERNKYLFYLLSEK
jgi:murein DD-endopeptidase MepM/ murein hydrolase activator NlpD